PVDEVVVHRLLHVDPGGGRALLTAEAEGGAGDAFDRGVDVGAGGDDHRVLAAHLGHDGLGAGLVGGPVDAHSDVIGPGEGDPVHPVVVGEVVAHHRAAAADHVERFRGQTGFLHHLVEVERHQGARV